MMWYRLESTCAPSASTITATWGVGFWLTTLKSSETQKYSSFLTLESSPKIRNRGKAAKGKIYPFFIATVILHVMRVFLARSAEIPRKLNIVEISLSVPLRSLFLKDIRCFATQFANTASTSFFWRSTTIRTFHGGDRVSQYISSQAWLSFRFSFIYDARDDHSNPIHSNFSTRSFGGSLSFLRKEHCWWCSLLFWIPPLQ